MKKRVSLTLSEDLLKRVDKFIGKISDNRSSVFEKLLKKSLLITTPKTAVILIGSKKEKVLFKEFNGKKIIDYHLENFTLAGVNKIIFVGDELNGVKKYVKEKQGEFLFVNDNNSGTAGALKETRHLIHNTFYLVYGDVVSNIDYIDFYRFHITSHALASIALTTSNTPNKYGIVEVKGTTVIGFKEKPNKSENFLISSGNFVVEPEVIDMLKKDVASVEKNILPKLVSLKKLAGYTFSGKWKDFGEEKN